MVEEAEEVEFVAAPTRKAPPLPQPAVQQPINGTEKVFEESELEEGRIIAELQLRHTPVVSVSESTVVVDHTIEEKKQEEKNKKHRKPPPKRYTATGIRIGNRFGHQKPPKKFSHPKMKKRHSKPPPKRFTPERERKNRLRRLVPPKMIKTASFVNGNARLEGRTPGGSIPRPPIESPPKHVLASSKVEGRRIGGRGGGPPGMSRGDGPPGMTSLPSWNTNNVTPPPPAFTPPRHLYAAKNHQSIHDFGKSLFAEATK
jgi:hypothetical protein